MSVPFAVHFAAKAEQFLYSLLEFSRFSFYNSRKRNSPPGPKARAIKGKHPTGIPVCPKSEGN